MNSKRLYYLLLGVVALLAVGLLAGTYGANVVLAGQAAKLTGLKAKTMALSQEQLSLNKAKKDVKTYASLEQIAKSVVPEDKDQAEAVREIVNIAGNNNISLATISFPASTLGNLPNGTTAPTTATTPSSTATPAKLSPTSASSLSQLQAVKNIPGVYQLQITVQGDPNKPVDYNKFVAFLSDLEHNRRTAQVNTITIAPDAADRTKLSFSLTLDEYIKP